MRADMSIVIFIIVAVVIAGAILVMGMGGLTQVGGGLEQILGLGEQVKSELTPKDIKSKCTTWLHSGTNQFNPETVQNLGVAEAFNPYPRFWEACGDPLSALVIVCKSGSDTCESGVINKDAYVVGSDIGRPGLRANGKDTIECCTIACGIAIQKFDECSLTSNNDAEQVQCFNEAMALERPRC